MLPCTEKNQSGYVVSTGSGQTLQQAPNIQESAKIMKNQATATGEKSLIVQFLKRHRPIKNN